MELYLSACFFLTGRTNTQEGLEYANQLLFSKRGGDRPGNTDVILLITDGRATPILNEKLDQTVNPTYLT